MVGLHSNPSGAVDGDRLLHRGGAYAARAGPEVPGVPCTAAPGTPGASPRSAPVRCYALLDLSHLGGSVVGAGELARRHRIDGVLAREQPRLRPCNTIPIPQQ